MSRLKLVNLGHPALRARSRSVTKKELRTKRFQAFLDSLAQVCLDNKGVGIAAPQVGVNKRVIVVNVDPKNSRYPDKKPFPLTIVINPKVIERSKATNEDWEGDLSADIRGLVPRANTCIVAGIDRHGNSLKIKLDYDFHARVFQHEIDHLNGIFFIDRVRRKETLALLPEWKKYWKDKDLNNG